MGLIGRLLLYLLLAVAAVRMVVYFAYAAAMLPMPLESHNLEAKMVLLAYRAGRGLSLYPAWWDYPHVTNFFGPVDFLVVGLLGRLLGGGIRGLFLIGRVVSFASGLLTTLVVAAWIGRRYGRGAGLAGGVLSLGGGPMYGFTVMVRPDALAELLGVGGFLLGVGRARQARAAGVALLILAILTKQTAGTFLLATALVWFLEGERRRALGVLGGGVAALIVVVVAVNVLLEPHFARSLIAEAMMPWDFAAWRALLDRIIEACPDLLFLPALGLGLWLGDRPREVRPAVLSAVLLAASLGLSGKMGADMNYYLSLRVAEAMSVGALWHAVHAAEGRGRSRSAVLAAATALATVSIVPGLVPAAGLCDRAWRKAAYFERPDGRAVLLAFRVAAARAEDPRIHLLTDSGLLDIYQGERAAYGDPWLFRTLVETGRLRPTAMIERIDSQYYDAIITIRDMTSPRYIREDFRLPAVLVEHARAHYVLREVRPGLYYYGRRGGRWPPTGLSSR